MARAPNAASSGFPRRLATAAIGLPLLLLVLLAGNPAVAVLAAAAAAVGAWEAAGLVSATGAPALRLPAAALALGVAGAGALSGGAVATVCGVGAGLLLLRAANANRSPLQLGATWAATFGSALYVGVPLASAVLLRDRPFGLDWLLVAVLTTFATDTGAYGVGRLFGRRRMAPNISPGKTWEGAAGGLVAAVLAAVALAGLLGMPFDVLRAAGLGAAIAVLSQAGDLAESKLKRLAGAKESGNLLPGHGGLLDRLDSLVPVFPLVYYVAWAWPA